MTTPDDALRDHEKARSMYAEESDPDSRSPDRGDHGGSSLGDGPPPKPGTDQAPDSASHGNASTDKPENYGGGYGGQPRPKSG